jgi:hypothetical protein
MTLVSMLLHPCRVLLFFCCHPPTHTPTHAHIDSHILFPHPPFRPTPKQLSLTHTRAPTPNTILYSTLIITTRVAGLVNIPIMMPNRIRGMILPVTLMAMADVHRWIVIIPIPAPGP